MSNITRGVRNNNPFNIKISKSSWLGKLSSNTDGTFEQFESMCFGLRAGLKLLFNYVRSGFDTPRAIISRFAPSSENNLKAYLSYVERQGVLLDYKIDVSCYHGRFALCRLARVIVFYESRYAVATRDLLKIVCEFNLV